MSHTNQNSKPKTSGVNQSSEKMLMLMEFLSEQDEPIRLLDISKQTGMNISTASRFLSALQAQGYATQDIDTGRYCLTYKICKIANNVSVRNDMRHIALPHLKSLSRQMSCTCNLAVEYDWAVMYLEVVTPPNQISATLQRIGGVAPLHCTGVGKLFLTEYSEQKLIELKQVRGFEHYTEFTLTSIEQLKAEVEKIRQQGYSFDNQECELGTRCMSAPIRDYTHRIVAAISVNAPLFKMTDEFIAQNLPILLSTASSISSHLGYFGERNVLRGE